VRTTRLDDSSLRGHYEIFTSSDIFSSSSCSTGAIEGFEGVATSSTMTKFSPASTKPNWHLEQCGTYVKKRLRLLFNKLG
jgi:hypothetical protein